MRFIIVTIMLACCGVADANPRIASAYRSAEMASERLVIEVNPTEARFTGDFHFRFREPPDQYNRTNPVALCGIDIWLPNPPGLGPQETAFWKFLNTSNPPVRIRNVRVTPENQTLLQNLLDLKLTIAGQAFPMQGFEISPKRDASLDEAGSCCMSVWFAVPVALLSGNDPVVISYRQPLHRSEGFRRLFYVPEFYGLPPQYVTATTNRAHYSITIEASPKCSLQGTNGSEGFTLQPRQSITLTPGHYRPIRALVRPCDHAEEIPPSKDAH